MVSKQFYKALSGKVFSNAQIRTSNDTCPYNIGKTAVINFVGKGYKDPNLEVVVTVDNNKEVFRHSARDTEIWFHEGWGGCDVIYKDENGFKTTIILHFTMPIKVSRW